MKKSKSSIDFKRFYINDEFHFMFGLGLLLYRSYCTQMSESFLEVSDTVSFAKL